MHLRDKEDFLAVPKPLVTPYRRFLQPRTLDAPPTVILWWGTLGYAGKVTLGDLHAVENLSRALTERGHRHAILSHPDLRLAGHLSVDDIFALRRTISRIVFVCGPLLDRAWLRDFFAVHAAARKFAVGVSILPAEQRMTARFDGVVARDGVAESYFDLAPYGLSAGELAPQIPPRRVGLCLRGPQKEYGAGRQSQHDKAGRLFADAIRAHGFEMHEIDTELTPEQGADAIASRFRDADLIFTTRMHGALLGLAIGRPVIAIDQIPGGAKVTAVMGRIGWPLTFAAETVTAADLDAAIAGLGAPGVPAALSATRDHIQRLSLDAIERAAQLIAAP